MNNYLNQNATPWIKNAWWDGFWILSGLWLLIPYVIQLNQPTQLYLIQMLLILLFWMGHRLGTIFIPFCLGEYDQLVRKQRSRFIYIPVAIFMMSVIFLYIPKNLMNFSISTRIVILVLIRFCFDLVHMSSQHYGVISLYRIRAGQNPCENFKKVEKIYCYFVTLIVVVIASCINISGPKFIQHNFSPFFVANKTLWQWGGSASVFIFLIYMCFYEAKLQNSSLPKLLYILSIGIMAILFFYSHPLLMYFILSGQHFIVASGLIVRISSNSSKTYNPCLSHSIWAPFRQNQFSAICLLCFFSIFLTFIFKMTDWGWGKYLTLQFIPQLTEGFFFKLIIGIAYGFSFSHYAWDRAVYRMSDKDVREVSLPLLLRN